MRRAGIPQIGKAANCLFLNDRCFIDQTVPALLQKFIDRRIPYAGNIAEKLPDRLPGGSDSLENRCVEGVAAQFFEPLRRFFEETAIIRRQFLNFSPYRSDIFFFEISAEHNLRQRRKRTDEDRHAIIFELIHQICKRAVDTIAKRKKQLLFDLSRHCFLICAHIFQ